MSLIESLYDAHDQMLSQHEHELMARVLDRDRQTKALINTPNLAHALVRIEPVSFSHGIQLFGQSAKSIACNILSLYTSKRDATDTHFIPDRHLISVLVSEQSLCHMMLNTNSSRYSPATAIQALDDALPAYNPDRATIKAQVADEVDRDIGEINQELHSLLTNFAAAAAKGPLRKTFKDELLEQIQRVAKSTHTDAFYLRRVLEGLAKEKSMAQSEVANAINAYFSELTKTAALPRPEKGVSRQSNPLVNALESYYSEEERILLSKLVRAGIADFVAAHELVYNLKGDDPHGNVLVRALGSFAPDELKAKAKALCSLRNDMDNASRQESRRCHLLQQTVIEVSRRQGPCHQMFSEYGAQESDTYFVLTLHNAYEQSFYGNHDIRESDNVLEFALLQEDLMNCLRGYVNGGYTPCTLTSMAHHRIPEEPYHNTAIKMAIEQPSLDPKADEVMASVQQVIKRLAANLMQKVSTKAEKQAIQDDLNALVELLATHGDVRRNIFANKSQALTEVVTADLKRQVLQMTAELRLHHDQVAEVLALMDGRSGTD